MTLDWENLEITKVNLSSNMHPQIVAFSDLRENRGRKGVIWRKAQGLLQNQINLPKSQIYVW